MAVPNKCHNCICRECLVADKCPRCAGCSGSIEKTKCGTFRSKEQRVAAFRTLLDSEDGDALRERISSLAPSGILTSVAMGRYDMGGFETRLTAFAGPSSREVKRTAQGNIRNLRQSPLIGSNKEK